MLSFLNSPHRFQRLLVIAVMVVALIIAGYWLEHHVAAIEARLSDMGHWAGIAFIALFIILTPFFFSVDILCIIAGAIFGLGNAVLYVMIATLFSAAVIFYVGRFLARERIQTLLQKHPKLMVLDQVIAEGGFKIMFLLRLLPFPFALLSYVFSTSKVRFLPYLLATTGIFFYNTSIIYFGYIAAHMSKQLSQGSEYTGPHNAMLVGGVLACIVILFLITKIAHAQITLMQPDLKEKLP